MTVSTRTIRYLLVVGLVAAALAGGSASGTPVVATRAGAPGGGCTVASEGPIGERWRGLDGPLGCPTSAQYDRPDGSRRQSFEHGEVAVATRRGAGNLVVVYQRGLDLVVHWGATASRYERFLVTWQRAGRRAGGREAGGGHSGSSILRNTGDGDYTVSITGCRTSGGRRTCEQAATAATVRFRRPLIGTADGVPPRCALLPVGKIRDRWAAMGSDRGPLGCPTGPDESVPGQPGRRQAFQRGEMAWLPNQGPDLVVTAYRLHNDAVFEWSTMGPYDYFRYDVALDGVWLGQANGPRRSVGGCTTSPA